MREMNIPARFQNPGICQKRKGKATKQEFVEVLLNCYRFLPPTNSVTGHISLLPSGCFAFFVKEAKQYF